MHELLLSDEELLALRDAVSEETVRLRQYLRMKDSTATENTRRREAMLSGLLAELKERCGKLR